MQNTLRQFLRFPKNGAPSDTTLSRILAKNHKGKASYETRYWVSSLDPDKVSAAEFQQIIQGHWGVENCLHWAKDREYEEDKHVLRGAGAKVWTVLTNIAVSLTQLLRTKERTWREVRESCLFDPLTTAKRLGFNP